MWDAGTGQPTGEPLRGHEDAVMSVAFSPDGTRIASGSRDNTVRLWDAKTGQPIGQPMRHENAVFSVAFSPDGTRIASGSMDKTLRLWDAKTGQPIGQPMRGHDGGVTRVAFSPDGTRIASGSIDKTVRLWDAKTGQPIGQPMSGHDQWVMSVAFSPDGTRIASGSIDKTLRLWDAKTGQPIGQPMTHDSAVPTVAFSPDGTRIASGSGDNKIRLWDASTGAASGNLTGHRSAVETVAFSPDGLRLVSGGDDQTVRIWDISSSQPLLGHEDAVAYAEFSEDSQRIRSGSLDGTVRRWDSATGRPIGQPMRVADHVRWLTPAGEDRMLSRGDAGLQLWDAHTGQPVGEPVRVITDAILPAGAWNPKTGRIGAQTQPGAIEIRDAELKRLGVPIWSGQPVTYFEFSPDGRTIVTSSFDSTVRLWDVETGKPVGKPLDSQGLILTTAFSPDGHLLAAGTQGAYREYAEHIASMGHSNLTTCWGSRPRRFRRHGHGVQSRRADARNGQRRRDDPIVGCGHKNPARRFSRRPHINSDESQLQSGRDKVAFDECGPRAADLAFAQGVPRCTVRQTHSQHESQPVEGMGLTRNRLHHRLSRTPDRR